MKLRRETSTFILALLAVAFKVLMVYEVSPTGFTKAENIGWYFNDEKEYFHFAENTVTEGRHYVDRNGTEDKTFRMPGMTVVYAPLRLFLSPSKALLAHGIFQLLLSVLAAFLFADLLFRITGSKLAYYLSFIALSLTGHINYYLPFFIAESLAISLIMILFYLIYRFHLGFKPKWGWLAGVVLTWLIFLKPYLGIVLPIFGIFLLVRATQEGRPIIKTLVPFIIPFLLIDGAWTVRNKLVVDSWQPFQSSLNWYKGNPALKARMEFTKSFGLTTEHWVPNSGSTWFMTDDHPRPTDEIFRKEIFMPPYDLDSLKKAREYLLLSEDQLNPRATEHAEISARILNGFINQLKETRPLDYHLMNRLRLMPRFVDQPLGYPNLKTANYPINVAYVFLDSLFFYLFIGLFLLSLFQLAKHIRSKNAWFALLAAIPMFILFFFTVVLRINELRFFAVAIPFIISCGLIGLAQLQDNSRIAKLSAGFMLMVFTMVLTYHSIQSNINW